MHWPYCARICPYCDFNVVRDRGRRDEQNRLVDAIVDDLGGYAAITSPRRLVSIFFGGGTPSLMAPDALTRIVEAARSLWPRSDGPEITLEANPTDAEAHHFAAMARGGVNRLSIGLQSLDDDALRFLGRNHDSAAARRAVERAGAVFPRVSLDLIYALPDQTSTSWASALTEVIALGSEHISPYQLTIEPGTAFHRAVSRGVMSLPAPDHAADLFDVTEAVLGAAGFDAYEISNHARGAAAQAAHNLIYWRGQDYIGVGPGAHGRLTLPKSRYATAAPRAIRDYVAHVNEKGLGATLSPLSAREVALERLFMGLRTSEGVPLAEIAPLAIPLGRLSNLATWVTVSDSRLRATKAGRPVLDRIIAMLAHGA